VARFYLDNDVPLTFALELTRLEHDAITAREMDAPHAGDYEQLLISTEYERILITHNERHFKELHSTWRLWLPHFGVDARYAGIRVIPQPPRSRRINLAQEIHGLIASRVEIVNSLWTWRTVGTWDLIEPRITFFDPSSRPGTQT